MDIGIEKAELNPRDQNSHWLRKIFLLAVVFAVISSIIVVRVQIKYRGRIIGENEIIPPQIGLIFGAGLRAKGEPSAVLEDRILLASRLYQSGRIGKFILSGDNSSVNHNEVQAMKNFALSQGLPESALIEDHAGLSTFESCARVKKVWDLNKVVLLTQKYHLRRALYLCNELGVDAVGVAAENRGYKSQLKFSLREWLASLQAFWQVKF